MRRLGKRGGGEEVKPAEDCKINTANNSEDVQYKYSLLSPVRRLPENSQC
jgi:hypothetical protein